MTVLTDGQLRDFERDGFVVLGRIADAAQVTNLLETERRFRPNPTQAFAAKGAPSKLLVRDQLCHRASAVRIFCLSGAHIPAVGQVLGPDVAFTHTQFICKLPEDEPATETGAPSWIPLHQDEGYGRLDPPLDATVWTALTDTDETNGCLVIVPGSHHDGVLEHHEAESNPALREAHAEGAVPLPLAAGEAVLFSGLTLHGSGPNYTDAPRVGMHARYCHPGVRMMLAGGQPVLDDRHSWMVLGNAHLDGGVSANAHFTSS